MREQAAAYPLCHLLCSKSFPFLFRNTHETEWDGTTLYCLALRRLRPEDSKFEASLVYMRPCLQNNNDNKNQREKTLNKHAQMFVHRLFLIWSALFHVHSLLGGLQRYTAYFLRGFICLCPISKRFNERGRLKLSAAVPDFILELPSHLPFSLGDSAWTLIRVPLGRAP